MRFSEKIHILCVKNGNISDAELARRLQISPQNMWNKFKRDNFSVNELEEIAKVLGCSLEVSFIFDKTGEKI